MCPLFTWSAVGFHRFHFSSHSKAKQPITTHHVPPLGLALDVATVVGLSPHLSCPTGDGGIGQSRLLASPDVMFSVPGQEV